MDVRVTHTSHLSSKKKVKIVLNNIFKPETQWMKITLKNSHEYIQAINEVLKKKFAQKN